MRIEDWDLSTDVLSTLLILGSPNSYNAFLYALFMHFCTYEYVSVIWPPNQLKFNKKENSSLTACNIVFLGSQHIDWSRACLLLIVPTAQAWCCWNCDLSSQGESRWIRFSFKKLLIPLFIAPNPTLSHEPFLRFAIYHHRLILAPWIVYGIPRTHTTLVSIFLVLASVPSEIRFEEFCNARDSSLVRVCLRSTDVNILRLHLRTLVESYLRLLTRWSQKGLRLRMVRVAMRMNLFVRSVDTIKPQQQS